MTDNEKKARELAKDRKWLLKRLLSAKNCLDRIIQGHHTPWKFDFQTKRLISKSGRIVLQWQIRRHPERPINYENQQTSTGTVIFKEV